MSAAATRPIVSPWDALAQDYDRIFTESAVGRAQRAAVREVARRTFRSGGRILELNCGTDVDAIFLARHGMRVDAFDQSPAMVAVARSAVRAQGVEDKVTIALLATESLADCRGSYDGAFSNFAGLNCVTDLGTVARNLALRLKPGAPALLCFCTRVCAWEMAWYLCHGRPARAVRRLRRGGVTAELAPGAAVHVEYPSVRAIRKCFSPSFRLVAIQGIGIAVPPSYVEPLARRHPRLFRAAEAFDATFSAWPLLRIVGDHVLLQFERCAV